MGNYVIIGGTKGIGLSIRHLLEKDGHSVWYSGRNPDNQTDSHCFPWIVPGQNNIPENIPNDIHGFVYAPGLISLKPFHRISLQDFRDDFEVQCLGAIQSLQLWYPRLKSAPSSSVILFSTVAVKTGMSFHSKVSVSKGAVEGLTLALSAEWAPQIRVNAIAPSLTQTELAESLINSPEKVLNNGQRHPLKRIGQAEDIAHMAHLLLTDKGSWITGQIIHVDGGLSALR